MSSKSKNKGNLWERQLCKTLAGLFNGNFMRVPNSGALIGGKNKKRIEYMSAGQVKLSKGDIIPPDHMPRLVIECKNYRDFPWHQIYTQDVVYLEKWIAQTLEPLEPGDFWLLCFKITNRGQYVVFDKKLLDKFVVNNHTVYKDYIITDLMSFLENNVGIILQLSQQIVSEES